jgi:ABC-type phosphate transport system substrate-binding protein
MKKMIFPVVGAGGLLAVALAIANSRRHLAVVGSAVLLVAQTNAPAQLINGAGSTFDYPAFTKWFEAYGAMDASVHFNYQSIGSGGGQQQLLKQTVDFGASDAPPAKSCTFPSSPAAWRSSTTSACPARRS